MLDCLIQNTEFESIGIVSRDIAVGSLFCGYEIVGTDDHLEKLYQGEYQYAFIAVGSVGDVTARQRISNHLKDIGFQMPYIMDATAAVSHSVAISDGVFVGKNAIVNANSTLGECCIINSGSIVEHDCTIGAFAHISPGAVLCGNVCVQENAHIGANATVLQGLAVGAGALVGAGTVVTKNVLSFTTVIGNPGHVMGS